MIKNLNKKLPSNTLIYLDPPYYVKGKELYMNYYSDEDHKKISEEINKTKKQKWIITYDNVDFIKKLYEDNLQTNYNLYYSAGKSKHGSELIIFSDNLKIIKPMEN